METRRVSEDLHRLLANASGYHLLQKAIIKENNFSANPVKAIGSIPLNTRDIFTHNRAKSFPMFTKQTVSQVVQAYQANAIGNRVWSGIVALRLCNALVNRLVT